TNYPSDTNLSGTGTIVWSDCQDTNGWCRVEMCTYGDIATAENIYVEGYVVNIDTDERKDWGPVELGTCGRTGGIPNGFAIDAYTQDCGVNGSNRTISHFLKAEWDTTSQGTFIGAASEIEGEGAEPDPPTATGITVFTGGSINAP
ncbi:unnamed protein product, partial [marine sediment metagenome]